MVCKYRESSSLSLATRTKLSDGLPRILALREHKRSSWLEVIVVPGFDCLAALALLMPSRFRRYRSAINGSPTPSRGTIEDFGKS